MSPEAFQLSRNLGGRYRILDFDGSDVPQSSGATSLFLFQVKFSASSCMALAVYRSPIATLFRLHVALGGPNGDFRIQTRHMKPMNVTRRQSLPKVESRRIPTTSRRRFETHFADDEGFQACTEHCEPQAGLEHVNKISLREPRPFKAAL